MGERISRVRQVNGASVAATKPLSVGQPLDASTRASLEPRFAHDFANVRIHADDSAAQSAAALNARAYTIGNDIVLGEGEYRPDTVDGQELLAHELTHVVQQAGTGASGLKPLSHASDASEVEARSNSHAVTSGHAASVSSSPGAAIAREEAGGGGGEEDESLLSKGLWWLGSKIPGGIGEAIEGTHSLKEGAEAKSPMEQVTKLMSAGISPLKVASEFGGWAEKGAEGLEANLGAAVGGMSLGTDILDTISDFSKGNISGGVFDVGKTLMSGGGLAAQVAGGSASLLGEGGVASLLTGGGLGEGALLTTGMGDILSLGAGAAEAGAAGAGAVGAGALATAGGAVLASGAAGYMAGDYLAKHTEVGEDTQGVLGWLDRAMGGDPEHGKSALVAMDDYRQEQWDKGGLGYLKGAGAALGEGAIATVGAIGGLAEGAVHGVEALGEGAVHGIESVGEAIWDWL
jgi:hypothetical protein